MKNILITLFVISTLFIAGRNGKATTVYQWTDADGVVHFSDSAPPQDGTTETREINFGSFASTTSDQETLSIIEQANIMAEWNKQAMEQHLALKQMELEQQRLSQEIEFSQQDSLNRSREYDQSRPHYYVFPQAVNYRYREQWYNQPYHQQLYRPHVRKRPPASRSYPGPGQSRTRTGFVTR